MRFCEGIAKAKLGLDVPPGTAIAITSANMPTIPAGHSILVETYFKWRGRYLPQANNRFSRLQCNAAPNDEFGIYGYNSGVGYLELYKIQNAAWDEWGSVLYKNIAGITQVCVLLDKTNTLKRIYHNSALTWSAAIGAVVPDFSGGTNNFRIVVTPSSFSCVRILDRMTTMTACPADIDAAIARMYRRPMVLDASLQAVSIIASQYDMEDPGYGTAALTTIADHGIVGGYNLSSGATDLRPMLTIVEKP